MAPTAKHSKLAIAWVIKQITKTMIKKHLNFQLRINRNGEK